MVSCCLWGKRRAAPPRISTPSMCTQTSQSYSSSFRIFVHDPRLLFPHPGHEGVVTSGPICLFTYHACVIACPISMTMHIDPSAQPDPREAMCVWQPLLPPLWRVLGTLPSWLPPLPTFHARRDLITQKLVQRRIVCFYGPGTRAAVNLGWLLEPPLGTVQAVGGAFTSTPHFVPSLSSCLGLYPYPENQSSIWYLSQWGRRRSGTGRGGRGCGQSKLTHNRCSINVT